MALGGVPAGSAKSHDAAIAVAERTGIEGGSTLSATFTVAVFDATAERPTVASEASPIWPTRGRRAPPASSPAIHLERPLPSMPAAIAKLPPRSTSVDQGIRRIEEDESARRATSAAAAVIATVAS